MDVLKHNFIRHTDKTNGRYCTRTCPWKSYLLISIAQQYIRRINRLDIKINDMDSKNKDFEDEYIICDRCDLVSRLLFYELFDQVLHDFTIMQLLIYCNFQCNNFFDLDIQFYKCIYEISFLAVDIPLILYTLTSVCNLYT